MATGRIVDLWHRKDRTRTDRYGTGKRWQGIWNADSGTVIKKSFEYRDAAQAWIDTQTHDNMLTPGGLKQPILFEKYYDLWFEKQAHQRPNSIRTLKSHCSNWVVPSFEGKYMNQIEQADVQRAVYSWQDSNADSTTKLMLTYTSQIFAEAVHDKYIRESPCTRVRLRVEATETDEDQDPVHIISEKTFRKLHQLLKPIYKDAAIVAGATGLRPKELIGLCREDIDFESSNIRITKQDVSKSVHAIKRGPLKTKHSRRSISFGAELQDVLRALCANAGPKGRLFHDGGKPLLYQRFKYEWSRVRLVLPEIGSGWHQLRHYHASVLISKGVSPVAVAARLGHKDALMVLSVYAHLWLEDISRMAEIGDSVVVSIDRKATDQPQVA